MFRRLIFLSLVLFGAISASATTTLQFSVSPNGATNFANSEGVATNGMLWGVLVDSGNNGFQAGNYDAFDVNTSGFLTVGGVATDDYYFYTGTSTSTLGAPFFAGSEAGAGGITTANSVPTTGDGVAGVNASDSFGLIWFESSRANTGDDYGFFTDASFTLTAGGVNDYSSVFAGADPVRSASYTIGAVPEPSRMLLLGLAMMGLIMRRRR